MNAIFQQLLSLLVAPPGNLIYHLVLAFAVFTSLQVALLSRKLTQEPGVSGRPLLGLNLLLIAQLALFLSTGLAWQGVVNPHSFLPIFDRAVVLFSVIWIGWLWAFPRPSRAADIITGLLNLAVVVLFLFTFTQWQLEDSSLPFNASWQDWTWALSTLGVAVLAATLILFRRPDNWGMGLAMLVLTILGHIAHLFLAPISNDFSSYIRLAQLAAYPLLPSLLVRSGQSTIQGEVEGVERSNHMARSMDLHTIHAWLELSLQENPDRIHAAVARAVAQTMQADLCLVVAAPQSETAPVELLGGYDVIREEDLPRAFLDQSRVPAVSNALAKGKPLRISTAETQPPDLTGLGIALGLGEVGNVLLIPLLQTGAPWGGLLLLTPYSQREWSPDDPNYLASEADSIMKILLRERAKVQPSINSEELRASLVELAAELNLLRDENKAMSRELSHLRTIGGRSASAPGTEIENLLALQHESQSVINALQAENARLQAQLTKYTENVQEMAISRSEPISRAEALQMENELRATLEETARLQNLLAASNIRSLELERKLTHNPPVTGEEHEVIASIVQELRQPMASVMGYTDLLLAETVGILGALQRKFLERVRAATERLRSLMDDLIQVTSIGNESVELVHQPVDLSVVIDAAITDVSARMREKNIQLSIELPDELPLIYVDREGIQQVIGQLLQNASLVTPIDGTITLRAGLKVDQPNEYLILQVTDEGGGIAAEDLPVVFSRRFRAENVLIQGVGDTGVGLSIARTLVEAHGGRIWVESDPAKRTSTYSVLLPMYPSREKEKAGA